jgi:hypothetical protein
MVMKNSKIEKLLDKFYLTHEDFRDCKIELIKSGHNRTVYSLIAKNDKKYIAKKGNASKDLGSSNLNDVKAQSFLKEMGCDFVPEIIYWDSANDFYIESFVGKEDIACNNLDDKDLDTFAEQLVFVHSLSAKQYQKFSAEHGFDKPKIVLPLDNLNVFGFSRFEIVKELCPDNYVKDWLNTRLHNSLTYLQKNSIMNESAHLNWGDIGENLRKNDSSLYFIDWELSRLGSGTELSYIKIHSHLSTEKFNYLVSRYAFYSGKTINELLTGIISTEKLTRVNDVVWAAMKWGQSETAEDKEKYKELTYKRIKMAEEIL